MRTTRPYAAAIVLLRSRTTAAFPIGGAWTTSPVLGRMHAVGAATAGVPAQLLKMQRGHVLTATEPAIVLRRLAEAFDAFGALRAEPARLCA